MLLSLVLIVAAAPPVDASKLTLSPPAAIIEIDSKKLKGEPYRVAWSPDARQMYLQTVDRDRAGNVRATYHYVLNGQAISPVDQEPPWSVNYWTWKSTQAAPGLPSFKIEVDQQQKRLTSTSTPVGGDLAKGGVEGGSSGAGASAVSQNTGAYSAAEQSQMANYYILRLKGEVIGEFVNQAAIPGLTFGWGPTNSGLIAFTGRDGRVVIMDNQGRKQDVPSAKGALLPAWTEDGRKLAYLERSGKNKFALKVVDVTQPPQ